MSTDTSVLRSMCLQIQSLHDRIMSVKCIVFGAKLYLCISNGVCEDIDGFKNTLENISVLLNSIELIEA